MRVTVVSLSLLLLLLPALPPHALAQAAFAVATIKPSATSVPFEHDGKTDTYLDTLRMQDVTVMTCLKFAYGIQYAHHPHGGARPSRPEPRATKDAG